MLAVSFSALQSGYQQRDHWPTFQVGNRPTGNARSAVPSLVFLLLLPALPIRTPGMRCGHDHSAQDQSNDERDEEHHGTADSVKDIACPAPLAHLPGHTSGPRYESAQRIRPRSLDQVPWRRGF